MYFDIPREAMIELIELFNGVCGLTEEEAMPSFRIETDNDEVIVEASFDYHSGREGHWTRHCPVYVFTGNREENPGIQWVFLYDAWYPPDTGTEEEQSINALRSAAAHGVG